MSNKYIRHQNLCIEINNLYKSKNIEYGDSFGKLYQEVGLLGAAGQLYHKLQRIITVAKLEAEGEEIVHESLRDNLIDLANYSLMTVLELDGEERE